MEFSPFVITNKGQALMSKVMQGATFCTFTTIRLSSESYSESQIPMLTVLDNVKQIAPVTRKTALNNTSILIEGALDNTELTTGYNIQTIGIYAKSQDEDEILYAVARATTAGYMPPYNGVTVSGATFKFAITVGNANNVTITVDPAGYASLADVQGLHDEIANLAEEASNNYSPANHTHTAAEVGAAAENHTHDYAAANHTHTAADIGAAAASHTHTAAEVGAVKKSGDTMTGTLNVSGSGTCVSNVNPDTSTEMLMRAYEKFGMIACAALDKNGRYRALYVSADDVTMDWIARVVTNMPGDVDAAGTWASFRLYHSGMITPIPVIHGGIGTNTKGSTACNNIGAVYNNPAALWRLIDVATENKGDWMLERKVTAVQEGSNGYIGINIANDAMYRTNRKADGTYRAYKVYDTGNKPTAADVGAAAVGHTHTAADVGAQAALGFTPVQQGGGVGQGNNKIKVGWNGSALKATVDSTDLGAFRFGSNVQLLWQSTDGGATFPAQTITLSKSPTLIVIVCECSTATGEQGQLGTTIARKAGYGFCHVQQLVLDPKYVNFRRFSYNSGSIKFEGGYKMVNGTTATEDNTACVPISIYGIMD